jgi:SAM-dependent methyltransferase
MNHADHVSLIQGGVAANAGVWADLGSGTGAFTLALADLLRAGGEIYSVDRDAGALREQEHAMRARFPHVNVHYIAVDFTRRLSLPPLDGIVMANSLHFQRDKVPVAQAIRDYLRPGGRFILVEYNVDRGNMWVPYPISFSTWQAMARRAGFAGTTMLASVPSRFLGQIYAALSE